MFRKKVIVWFVTYYELNRLNMIKMELQLVNEEKTNGNRKYPKTVM